MLKNLALILIIISIAACGSGTGSMSLDTGGGVSTASGSAGALSAAEVKAKILSSLATASPDTYKQGEIIVKFKSGLVSSLSADLHRAMGSSVIRKLSSADTDVVSVPQGMTVAEAVTIYMDNPLVEYAEPNYRVYLAGAPNDPYYVQQWALHNDGSTMNSIVDADIDAPEAWDFWQGDRWMVVAVIDTGVDYGHPDLGPNMWINTAENPTNGIDDDLNGRIDDFRGWDFGNGDNNPNDEHGHGTHVAGIIGAFGNNNTGVAGVNWYVRIMPVKIFSRDPLTQTLTAYVTAAVDGVNYAVTKGARVINASWHICADFEHPCAYSQTLFDAISNANTNGVLFVAAAGNGGNDGKGDDNDIYPVYPANYDLPNIITVAATDQDDKLTSFSNYGVNTVDVAAPGNHTLSTMAREYYTTGYDTLEGTSMAAPHVTGLAALIMTYPDYVTLGYTMSQFRAMIEAFVDKKSQFTQYIKTGGRINAYHTLSSMVKPNAPTATSTVPTEVNLSWTPRQSETARERIRLIIERSVGNNTSYQVLAMDIPGTSTSYKDTSVTGGTTYYYRIRAHKNFDSANFPYVPTAQRDIYSLYSVETSITTPVTPVDQGGGGCSIASRPVSANTAVADTIILLLPVAAIYLVRRFRK